MSQRITIIIPTRERCDTLRWAIKTCVTQDYDNLEILISDNASTDATRDVVAEYDDGRIRYVNPGKRLGMSEHWEFAFSHVTSGHLGVIGDDDGMLPGSIEELAQIIDPERPLVWPIQQYFWPSFADPDLANCVVLPLKQPAVVREVCSQDTVRQVLEDSSKYPQLPSPYFGLVPAAAFDRIRQRSNQVFHSIIPDIYAGFAVAAVCDSYMYSERSYSLAGQSWHSNGASQLSGRGKDDVNSPATMFDKENTIEFHRDLVYAPSIPIVVAETALQAIEHVGLRARVDVSAAMTAALRDPLYLFNPKVRPGIDGALKQTAMIHGLDGFLEREMLRSRKRSLARTLKAAFGSIFVQHPLLECDPRAVGNVFEAGAFVVARRPRFEAPLIGPLRRLAARLPKLKRAVRTAKRRLRINPEGSPAAG